MATDWTAFPMTSALATAIALRTGITSLDPVPQIFTYLPPPEDVVSDVIILGFMSLDFDDPERAHAGGPRFDEYIELVSRIQLTRPGAGQSVADEARTRAKVLLAEVDDEVRDNLPTVGNQSWAGKVVDREMILIATRDQNNVGAMQASIDFAIRYKARTS